MRKKTFMRCLALCWLASLPMLATATAASVVDRIVAVVNEDIILLSELQARLSPFIQRIRAQGFDIDRERDAVYRVREDVLNSLIDEKLTDQEIRQNDIRVDDAEVDRTIERIKSANAFTDEDLRGFLEQEAMSMDAYRQKIREQLLRAKLVNYQVKSKIVITEEDIRDYYDSHSAAYGGKTRYRLRNILIRPPQSASAEAREAVVATLASIRAKAVDSAAFAALARTHSQSPTAETGGELGEFTADMLSPEIRQALSGVTAGNTTPVVDTDQGFQLFFVEAIAQQAGKPLDTVREEIRQKLYTDIVDEKFASWLEELRNRSHIKIIN